MPPIVSVIVPCYNEYGTITLLLDALYAQSYPKNAMEVVIADGGSEDGTLEMIDEWCKKHPDLKVNLVNNPKRIIPAALNSAIKASKGEFIVRLDAHSKPREDYVKRSLMDLEKELGQNVGGVWDIQPGADHWIARGIAAAAGHPIGVGGAQYRYTDKAAYVDTVPFGAFKRDLIDKIGMFDESLLTNEDYEFNTRVRQSGGKIWLDPEIRSVYFARKDLRSLARQYWRYGYWKWHMLRRYPETLRPRQALPPLFILSLIILFVFSLFLPQALYVLLSLISLYIIILILAGIQLSLRQKDPALILGAPLAIACMHFSWGSGFIWGVLRPQNKK
jgi:glycosyltransferase involved in cell wall biosynthesis